MAIAYVSGAHTSSASAAGTLTLTYAPTAGNQVVVAVAFPSTPGGTLVVKDNLGNTLAAGPSQGTSPFIFTFAYFNAVVPSGVTGFTATWTGTIAIAMAVAEYSGAAGTDTATDATRHNAVNSTTATLSVATFSANEFVVMAVCSSQVLTTTVGNSRQSDTTQTSIKILLQDNVGGPSAVTNTATQPLSTFWCAAAVVVGFAGNARVPQDVELVLRTGTPRAEVPQDVTLVLRSPSPRAHVPQDVMLVLFKRAPAVPAVPHFLFAPHQKRRKPHQVRHMKMFGLFGGRRIHPNTAVMG